jgi:hypothetical protein
MTFNELTYGITLVTPVFWTLAEGRKAGFIGVLVALVVGVGLGICSFLMTKSALQGRESAPRAWKTEP